MAGFGDVWEGLKGLGSLPNLVNLREGLEGLGRFVTVWKGLGGFDKVRNGSGRSEGFGWAHVERSLPHLAKQPFTSNGVRVRTGSQEKL